MADDLNMVELAAELTAAWLANPNTRTTPEDVPAFLQSMHAAVTRLASGSQSDESQTAPDKTYEPATTARKSLGSPDHIVSMIDGKKYKTLRRHLSTNGLTPEDYRARYNLKADYPMVAATYSEARRAMAKSIGLGRKTGAKVEKAGTAPAKSVRRSAKSAPDAAKQTPGAEG